jgi:hypothetical protein
MCTASPSANSASTGWSAARPGVVARADEADLHRDEHDERSRHPDVATRPRPDDREDQEERGEAVQAIAVA